MRKYDKKNKRNIAIIIAISVLIIVMFSLIIKIFLSTDKNDYLVSSGSIVFDKDKTIIKLEKDGIIKQKWNKEYYLIYNEENIELGDTAIAYNESDSSIHLYGKYYEISSGDEINITSDETIIKDTAITKFYKLSDRKYLVVDKEIKSNDGILSTSDFLMIDLDKVGNATLTNHKINLKTFKETIIATSNYTFDIASEILKYGSDIIDLKKIIGSSNTYTKDDLIPTDDENTDNASGGTGEGSGKGGNGSGGTGGTGEGTGSGNGGSGAGTTTSDKDNKKDDKKSSEKALIETAKRESKRASIVSLSSTSNKIIVDYVIYDPYSEYTSVYLEFSDASKSSVDKIYLSKDSTVYEFTKGIMPNTAYNIVFHYTYIDENNNDVDKPEEYIITTKKPNINISISRIASNKIYYTIEKEYGCNFTSATLKVISNGEEITSETINLSNTMPSGNISLEELGINKGDTIKLVLTDIKVNDSVVKDLQASTKIRY